jgi:uncharacterized protein (TIGR03000 family)
MRLSAIDVGLLALALSFPAVPAGQARAADAEERPVTLVVHVPADAQLEVEGAKTKTTGEVREFASPPLAAGKSYVYTLKATWTENGAEKSREIKVRVTGGKRVEVDFTAPAEPPAKPEAKPEPPAKPERKPEPKPDPSTKPEPKPEAPAKPEPKPEPPAKPEPKPEPPAKPDAKPESPAKPERKPEPKPEPPAKPELKPEPPAKPERKPEPPTKLDAKPEAPLKPERKPEPKPESPAKPEPKPEPPAKPEPKPEVPAKPEPKPEPPARPERKPEPPARPEPKPESPTRPEPKPEVRTRPEPKPEPPTRPTTPASAGPAIGLSMPPVLSLVPGGFPKQLPVTVVRRGFAGPVTVQFEDVPDGVTLKEATIPADQDKVYIDASASADAAAGAVNLLTVIAAADKVRAESLLPVRLTGRTVGPEPTPAKPASLKLEVPAAVEAPAGEKTAIAIKVLREGFTGPVRVKCSGLPGKNLPPFTIPADKDEKKVRLTVDKEGKAESLEVKIVAVGGDVRAEATCKLLVRALPPPSAGPALEVRLPPGLNLVPGGFPKQLPVTVVRRGFAGPVTVQFEDVPDGVTLKEATIPADQDKVYIDASASADAGAAELEVLVIGVADKARVEVTLPVKVIKR